MVKGSTQGAITDIDGKFTLSVDALPVTVVVSYIGYQKKEVKITSKGAIHITLAEDTQLMDEVIVTGYGTFKKSAYAGSASNVKSDKMADVPTVSFQDMLQGNATGVQFSASSGQPGASSNINIRGMGSINAGNTPLYVIDGVPVISGSINSMSSDSGLDIMSTINTNDIASITVIKDAAAASLYGSRAANGVIIITTKQGQQGKPKVSLQADWGYSDFAMDYRPVMNGQQRRDYIYNGLYAGQIRKGKTEQEATAYADDNIDDYAPIPWCGFIDWDDVLFKKGSHQQYEASVSGGADKFKYYSSIAYLKQDGITHRSGLERLTGRLNVDYKATNRLTLGANIFFSSVNQDVYSEGFTYTAPFYSSRSAVTPSDPVYNEDGTWNRAFIRIGDRNPALANEYDINRGVSRKEEENQGAGDQGMMFGYATNETENYMPVSLDLAHLLMRTLADIRKEGKVMTYLRPDSKSQVTIQYSDDNKPERIDSIVISTQHDEFDEDEKMLDKIREDVINILIPRVKEQIHSEKVLALFNNDIKYFVNPTGKFVIGGPHGDTGLTGRKIIVDTYGGKGAHGGGAFSGKDPSKVDRSAAYAARYIAKNMVAAGVADEILVQLSYAIGVAQPVSIYVNTYVKSNVMMNDGEIAKKIKELFDLRPKAIEQTLKLRQPMYLETASYGHMGRKNEMVRKTFTSMYHEPKTIEVELFTWEKLNLVNEIKNAFGLG